MRNKDVVEVGIREFRKGIDRFNLAREYRLSYITIKSKEEKGYKIKDNRTSQQELENCADFIARAIDIMLKGMNYAFNPEIDPSVLNGHDQVNLTKNLLEIYDIAPELKEIHDLLDDISNMSYYIHQFIKNAAYEGFRIHDSTLSKIFLYAEGLEEFGEKYGLNADYDTFNNKRMKKGT